MPFTLIYSPKQNRILGSLATNEYARLQDDLELIHLNLGQVLYESGDTLGYVYFPTTCIVSLISTTRKEAPRSWPSQATMAWWASLWC
jgi:hypothetical protein